MHSKCGPIRDSVPAYTPIGHTLKEPLYSGPCNDRARMSDGGSSRGVLKTKAFPGISVAQVVETVVGDCAIESVVVYQDRAEVKRAVPVRLTPGENEVIVYDLAECVDKNSIRYVRFVPIEH